MEKKISDYLHLYLGCEFIHVDDFFEEKIMKVDWRITKFWSENCKLILRPLSDMTKEESYELCQLLQWGVGESTMNDLVKYGVSGVDITVQEQAQFFRILLSKQFDLFGLIESGLAIDKTTLTK